LSVEFWQYKTSVAPNYAYSCHYCLKNIPRSRQPHQQCNKVSFIFSVKRGNPMKTKKKWETGTSFAFRIICHSPDWRRPQNIIFSMVLICLRLGRIGRPYARYEAYRSLKNCYRTIHQSRRHRISRLWVKIYTK